MSQVSPDDAASRDPAELTRFERLAFELARVTNETPAGKRLQELFLRTVSYTWIRAALARRMFCEGLDEITRMEPDRGVLFASNHRSFFDQYAVLLGVWMGPTPWARRLFFPVRANFFYERPLGVLVNYLVGAGAMYPPIFRQSARAAFNKEALERIVGFLAEPGAVVGVHPEGTRGKGPDPYEMLPAQPGIGQITLQAQPIVIPVFIHGLSNDIVGDVRANFASDVRQQRPVICVFGEPIDYAELAAQKPRPALYKKTADLIRSRILALAPREQALRAACQDGRLPDGHPGWLSNRAMGKLYARRG
jgi:1-acyl-sn-glycerol-3-phosphate acyltransferase